MAIINGTPQDDRDGAALNGTSEADEYLGLAGDDELISSAGNDTINGGEGRDTALYTDDPAGITGDLGAGTVTDGFGDTDTLIDIERLSGTEAHDDTLTGGGIDSLTLLGLGGNDSITSNNPGFFSNLIGGTGNDTLTNLDGGAFMEPGSGQDTVTGSADPDDYSIISYYFEAAAADQNAITGVTVTFTGGGGGTATDFAGDTDTFTDIDSARGTALDDLLVGDAGRQDLTGHQGNDTLDGGDGEDRVEYLRSNYLGVPLLGVSVDLSSGIATDPFGDIDTLLRIENVRGTDLADTLVGDAEDNDIEGEGGDDQLSGGGGDDYIEGNDGNDTIDGGDDDDDLRGNAGDDSLLGGDGRDDLRGGAGNDTLDGGAGDRDEATYRDAGGSVTGSLTTGIVSDGDGGTDTLLNIEELRGGDFSDTLTGAETGVSYIRGGGGDDVLTGNRTIDGFGTDLDGGAGNDTLVSIGGDAFFQPDIGNDTITGSAGFDIISYFFSAGYAAQPATSGVTFAFTAEGAGSATDHEGGTDTFTGIERAEGTMLADMLTGAAGFQDFRGFGGDDTINGGADYDLIDYSANRGDFGGTTGAGVTVDLTAGSATDPYGDTDTLINIEGVRGTGFADDITGDGSGQRLEGRDGNDTINGAGGDDEVRGEGGDDSLLGGEGNDELRGGGGNDTLDGGVGDSDEASYRDAGSGVSIDLTTGTANDGEGGTDTLVNIEAAEGSEFDDTIIGAMDEYSFLRGRGGDDSITGADDDQSVEIFGGAGDDTLTGGTGGAYFQGGTGDDLIVGGTVAEGFYLLSYFWDLDADDSASGISVTYTSDRAGTVADESGGTDTFSGIDRIEGTRNNDSFVGTTGFQDIRLHGGDDTVDGGADDDRVDYSRTREDFGPVSGVVVDLAAGMATDPYGGTDTLMNIEQVRGTDFADSIVGDSADNSLQARDGDDTLSGGAGNDYLEGGSGADTFIVSSGHEEVYIADFEIGIDRLDLTGFARADALAAFNNAQAGSAILTFGDGTVLTVDGDNVSPATLSLDDIDLASDNSAPTGAVVISGNAEIGGTLTADISSLADPDIIRTDTITYQWQRDGSDISGSQAQNATYEVIADDLFTEISVVVSYTDEGDTDEQAISSTIIPLPMDLSIDGDETSEPLDGGPGNDTINGGGGEDTITGSRGDDQIDGGTGSDTAAYSGAKAAHTVSVSASGIAVEDRRSDGDGTDQLTSIESLSFLDGDWPLDIFDNVADLTEQAFRDFIEVYIAYFNRSPDAEGLFFYGTAFANGTSLEDSAATFLNSAEYQATYPPGLSNQEFAEAVYNNVLGRIPDVLGLEFWVGVLNSGARSRDVFILEVLKGAKAPAPDDATQDFIDQKAADVAYLANKTDIGLYFAVTKGMSNVTNATTAMQLFDDGDQSDIDAAVAAIDGFYADALDPTNGEFLLQLVGVVDDPFMM